MGKTEADNLLTLDINWLSRRGLCSGFWNKTVTWTYGFDETKSSIGVEADMTANLPSLRLRYTQTDSWTGEKRKFDYEIRLATTACNFGGERWWFICPLTSGGIYCGRRVGKLYKDGDFFGCRHCHDLTYSSRNENRRSGWYNALRFVTLDNKIEELEHSIKRRQYGGVPTRKQRKLYKLYAQTSGAYSKIDVEGLR